MDGTVIGAIVGFGMDGLLWRPCAPAFATRVIRLFVIDYGDALLDPYGILDWESGTAERKKKANLDRVDGVKLNVEMKYFKKQEPGTTKVN